ncbi:hypothetical protein BaRGS_00004100, partial [Batillaria attramentaria]
DTFLAFEEIRLHPLSMAADKGETRKMATSSGFMAHAEFNNTDYAYAMNAHFV